MLRSGQAKSCGCYQKDLASENCIKNFKKYNKYDLQCCSYGIGYTSNNKKFYFDLEDYDKIKDICWSVSSNGYLVGWESGICLLFHRKILGDKVDKLDVDHINHNKLDNRKTNIRPCTRSQNLMNRSDEVNSCTKIKGVRYHKENKRYGAFIYVNKEEIKLGYYDNIEDAIKARRLAEEKYFGEYSYFNSVGLNREIGKEPSYN